MCCIVPNKAYLCDVNGDHLPGMEPHQTATFKKNSYEY